MRPRPIGITSTTGSMSLTTIPGVYKALVFGGGGGGGGMDTFYPYYGDAGGRGEGTQIAFFSGKAKVFNGASGAAGSDNANGGGDGLSGGNSYITDTRRNVIVVTANGGSGGERGGTFKSATAKPPNRNYVRVSPINNRPWFWTVQTNSSGGAIEVSFGRGGGSSTSGFSGGVFEIYRIG